MPISPDRARFIFQKVERCLVRLSSGEQAERVHDFRISVRRLETLMAEFVPRRGREQKKLLKVLG